MYNNNIENPPIDNNCCNITSNLALLVFGNISDKPTVDWTLLIIQDNQLVLDVYPLYH